MMSKMKHTPGPWFVSNGDLLRVARSNGGSPIVVAGVHKIGSRGGACLGDPLANARLIAAAPDLLEALKMVSGVDLHHEVLAAVDAAIAKAEGRS